MMMMMEAVAAPGDYLQFRQVLKDRYRKCTNHTKESSTSAIKPFFGPSKNALPQRVIQQSKALMPELINLLNKLVHQKPTTTTTQSGSCVDLKSERAKKLKESRDYPFLLSETAEDPKISKGSLSPKPDQNSMPKILSSKAKKSPDNKFKANPKGSPPKSCKPKMSSLKAKSKAVKSQSFAKDSVPVSCSRVLNSRLDEKLVTKSQASSAKQSLNHKQANPGNTKVMPKQRGAPCLKIKKRQVEGEDIVDVSSVIHDIFGRRRERKYRDYDDDDGDDRAMVSGFNDILKEERKSAKIARKEDEEERLRIEQEEKEERLKKAQKDLYRELGL